MPWVWGKVARIGVEVTKTFSFQVVIYLGDSIDKQGRNF